MIEMVEAARGLASSTHTDRLNLLAVDWLPGDDKLFLTYPSPALHDGVLISSGLMDWQVIGQPDPNGVSVPVLPNPMGGEATAVESGNRIRVAPRYTDRQIFNHLNNQIRMMSSPDAGLYDPYTWTERVKPHDNTYSVPGDATDILGLVSVSVQRIGFAGSFSLMDWTFQAEGSRSVIRLHTFMGDGMLSFTARRPFRGAIGIEDDATAVCGLTESMTDIPPLGAAGMLLLSDEGRRNNPAAQGDTRRKEDIPSTALATQGRELLRERDRRIVDEAGALTRRFSTRTSRLSYGSEGWR
jgi:hypothetical protein